jgi:tetratricopeptide (TPR) repeat protein
LINAQTDSHLWADTYDRKVTDMFEAESEIAKRIAETLQAKLTGREQQALAVKPTNNPEAYEAYLRGLSLDERNYISSSIDLTEKAAASYERAVQLDPNFALAWARLSFADTTISNVSNDTTAAAARREAAKRALDQALKLAPETPDTLLALGAYQYLVLGDPGATKATCERLIQMVPSSGEGRMYLGLLARNEGHWDQSVAYLEQALALDPRNLQNLTTAMLTYAGLRQFPTALKLCDRVLDIKPNDQDAMANKARIYQALGNLQEAAGLLSGINEASSGDAYETKASQLQFERNYGDLIRLQQARVTQIGSDFDQLNLALYQWMAGDTAGAKATAKKARNGLEQSSREEHKDTYLAGVMAGLSLVYALMGEKDSALKLAERAIMLYSRGGTESVWHAPAFEENLALIQTIVGENSRAISTLTRLLQTSYNDTGNSYAPAPVTPALLRLDPCWDPLRGDPAFQKLCEEKQPPATP